MAWNRWLNTATWFPPATSVGTIVSVYPEHDVHLVEFAAPWEMQQIRRSDMTPISEAQAQIIAAAVAPLARTLRMTDDSTDDELSAFIRGKPHP